MILPENTACLWVKILKLFHKKDLLVMYVIQKNTIFILKIQPRSYTNKM
jgi:hypothetical protein